MYDDGVRLFVETGPRGNLSAFVEDILRGKPQLTVPANVPRRSATAQLNHLVAQLAAQHVPIRFELLRSQEAQPIDWWPQLTSASNETTPVAEPIRPSTAIPAPVPVPPSVSPAVAVPDARLANAGAAGRVVAQYLDVMEQFLATQQTVMQRYLAARRSPQAGTAQTVRRRRRAASPQSPEAMIPPSLAARMSPPPPLTPPRFAEQPSAPSQPRQPAFGPLVGSVMEYVAGQRIVMRRKLEIEEDLYAQEHTVGGRNVSKLDAHQHGLPVAPMTFSLETMAELAQALFPQLAVHGVRNVELMRWLAFDEVDPSQVEAVAQVVPLSSPDALLPAATVAVDVEIVDLGNQANQPPPRMRWVAAKGTVLLGPSVAEPPPAGDFPLTGDRPCRISLESLYQNLFHGERFQGVERMPRYGTEGIEADIRVLPRNGLLRSNPAPRFVFDPVLTDVAMHPLAAWHLEQPDQSGRILLPFGLESLQLFGPLPEVGTPLISRVRTLQTTTRQFVHAVDVVDQQGRLRMRLTGAKYWRFYVPFGEINFHGPKDEYFISDRYPDLAEQLSSTPEPSCVRLDPPLDVLQPAMRAAIVKVAFSPAEQSAFRQLAGRDAEKSVWLFSRMAAKDAVRIAWSNRCGERLFPADMESQLDERGRPRIVHRDRQRTDSLPSVSVAHYKGRYVAAAADSTLLGVDLLKIDADAPTLLAQLAPQHRALIDAHDDPTAAGLRILAACRAATRALSGSIDELAATWQVEQFDPDSGLVVLAATAELLTAFPELDGRGPVTVATHRDDAWIAAITVDQQVRA
jgi:phosphopantetheinyl transferase (holo-ACP synthase)